MNGMGRGNGKIGRRAQDSVGRQSPRLEVRGDVARSNPSSPKASVSKTTGTRTFAAFAVVTPGLEALASFELRRMGIHNPRTQLGGVAFQATYEDVEKANLWSRICERVLLRVSTFEAHTFQDLEKAARRVAWKKWIRPNAAVAISASSHTSKLYHAGAIAQRVFDAINEVVGGVRGVSLSEAADLESAEAIDGDVGNGGQISGEATGVQRVFVRMDSDVCTISMDSSGERLHRRGYRRSVTPAPLRETLAAAVVLSGGLQNLVPSLAVKNGVAERGTPRDVRWFFDPMCGSGTLPIEAALLLCNVAPGMNRRFAFEDWPVHDPDAFREARHRAEGKQVSPPKGFQILGADVDGRAIQAAVCNASLANIPKDLIQWSVRDVRQTPQMKGSGLVITNPPYGQRLMDAPQVAQLFRGVGQAFRGAFQEGTSLAFLLPEEGCAFAKGMGFHLSCRTHFKNGGIPVGIWTGSISDVPQGL